jgi:hypothetical protein
MAQVVEKDMAGEHLGGWRWESTYCCTLGAPEAELLGGIDQAERHSHIAAVQLYGLEPTRPVQLRPLVACSRLQLAAVAGFPEQGIGS